MSLNSRRAFLRSSTMLAGLTAINPMEFLFDDKGIFYLRIDSPKDRINLIHTAGIYGQLHPYLNAEFGGFEKIQEQIRSLEAIPLLVDAGDFLDPAADYKAHLEVLKKLKACGYQFLTLGETEWKLDPTILKSLIQESGIRLLGSNYGQIGLEKGKDYFENSIITFGKYKIGLLGINDGFKSNPDDINRALKAGTRQAQYLKLIQNCDVVIALCNYSSVNSSVFRKGISAKCNYIDFILDGQTKGVRPGVNLLKNSQNEDLWHAQVADKGRYMTTLEVQMGKNFQMHQVSNRSGIPGTSHPKYLAQLHAELVSNKI